MAVSPYSRNCNRASERFDLDKFIADFREYIETVVKNETPEESRAALIRLGAMDEDGNIIVRHEGGWG